jgi:ATP-dependent DNA helicase RecQ
MSGASCRRRQILDHFGDGTAGAPRGRCCDVCDPDPALAQALVAAPIASSRKRASSSSSSSSFSSSSRQRSSTEHADDARATAIVPPIDEREFERLRQWRWSRAEGKPAYTVAANAALEEILRQRPTTLDELLAVHGIGPTFCERHGESLLEQLSEFGGRNRAGRSLETAAAVG